MTLAQPYNKTFSKGCVQCIAPETDRYHGDFQGTHRVHSSEILDPNLQLHTSRIEQSPTLVAWHHVRARVVRDHGNRCVDVSHPQVLIENVCGGANAARVVLVVDPNRRGAVGSRLDPHATVSAGEC